MKVLLVTMYWPPAGGGGVPRPLKFATHLADLGFETHVLAPGDPKRVHRDESLTPPPGVVVHRVRNLSPQVRRPGETLERTRGLARLGMRAVLAYRRVLVPDPSAPWALTAAPAARRIVRQHGIDVVITSSPPGSVQLIGLAVRRLTGVRWVAELRDSLVSHPHRRRAVRGERLLARSVAHRADAVVAVSEAIADEIRALAPRGPVEVIEHGADFEDFEGLEYRPSTERFRITHTGTMFARRDPRPFLEALARSSEEVVARFVGDFRDRDRAYAEKLGLGDRIEVLPYLPRHEALALQRDSEALLLLVPAGEGRGRFVITTKIFEYLAAGRPILAAVPSDGPAAELLRETGAGVIVSPDDADAIAGGLHSLVERWREGSLESVELAPELRDRLSRRARVEKLAGMLRSLP
ncbi:MAG: glycosyltransferase family 4 protein [Gaiellaceae bacterium]